MKEGGHIQLERLFESLGSIVSSPSRLFQHPTSLPQGSRVLSQDLLLLNSPYWALRAI